MGQDSRAAEQPALTSFEAVRRAIHFETPDRLPIGNRDTHGVRLGLIDVEQGYGAHPNTRVRDEWGCVWHRTEERNMGYVAVHPLADWSALGNYAWPDPDNPRFYEGMENQFEGSETKFVMTHLFGLIWERMWWLCGMEEILTGLYTDRSRIEYLADRLVEWDLAVIQNIGERFPGRIHGVTCTDDWGSQQATFVSPKLWCEFFQPRYARVFEGAHAQGWDIFMHSDGKINEIIGPWIDAGLDIVNITSPPLVGIKEIGDRFAGKICFWGGVDSQITLPLGTLEEIRDEVRLLLEHWATPEGGYVASGYGGAEEYDEGRDAIGVPAWKARAAFSAFEEFDPYRSRAEGGVNL